MNKDLNDNSKNETTLFKIFNSFNQNQRISSENKIKSYSG